MKRGNRSTRQSEDGSNHGTGFDAEVGRSAANYLPARQTLRSLREAAGDCRGCDLYKDATQTVFGAGKARARIILVGEQSGNSEDRSGHPFVGPADKLLHTAMQEAGIDPASIYITNAVKHFKFITRGKRRIYTPSPEPSRSGRAGRGLKRKSNK